MLFPDPVVDHAGIECACTTIKRTHLLCSHCHKEIEGKVYRSGLKVYDPYCWYMRYILDLENGERDRAGDRRKPSNKGSEHDR